MRDSGLLSCPQTLLLRSRNKVNDENKKEYIDNNSNNNNTPFTAATVSRRLKMAALDTVLQVALTNIHLGTTCGQNRTSGLDTTVVSLRMPPFLWSLQ